MSVILASGSPRRRELLTMLGLEDLRIIPAVSEERPPQGAGPEETVKALALAKGREVLPRAAADELVIAADTIVYIDGMILGKPADEAAASGMLRRLSGRRHTVYTGVAVLGRGRELVSVEATEVRFRELTEAEIFAYIRTGEPMDKAGAYGIQGRGSVLIDGITGDFFNVVGMPLARLYTMLRELGTDLLVRQ